MIKLENIEKVYKNGKVTALKNINLIIESKGFVAIVGKSGSGKSTLMNIIGLLDKPSSGEIFIDEINVLNLSKKKSNLIRSEYFNYIFQDNNLINDMNVRDNIFLPKALDKGSDTSILDLATIGLNGYDKKFPAYLSAGERQRVAIFRGITNNKKIILCDEPTANLDEENATIILELLKEISNDVLVIMISHNNYLVSKYADRIIKLEHGSIINDTYINKKSIIQTPIGNKPEINKKLPFIYACKLAFSTIKFRKIRMIISTFLFICFISLIASLFTFKNYNPITILEKELDIEYYMPSKHISGTAGKYYEDISDYYTNNYYFKNRLNKFFGESNVGYYQKLFDDNYIYFLDDSNLAKNEIILDQKLYYEKFGNVEFREHLTYTTNDITYNIVGLSSKGYSIASKSTIDTYKPKYVNIRGGLFELYNNYSYSSYLRSNMIYVNANCYDQLRELNLQDNQVAVSKYMHFRLGENKFDEKFYYKNINDIHPIELRANFVNLHGIFPEGISIKNTIDDFEIEDDFIVVNGKQFNKIIEDLPFYDGFLIKASNEQISHFYIKNDFQFNNARFDSMIDISTTINNDLLVPLYIVISFFIIILIFVNYLWFNNILMNKKYEIGILKCQGLSDNKTLVPTFICGLFILIPASLLSVPTTYTMLIGINKLFYRLNNIYDYNIVSFNVISLMSIILIVIGLFILNYLITMLKIKRLTIIDTFKIID